MVINFNEVIFFEGLLFFFTFAQLALLNNFSLQLVGDSSTQTLSRMVESCCLDVLWQLDSKLVKVSTLTLDFSYIESLFLKYLFEVFRLNSLFRFLIEENEAFFIDYC